MKNINLLSNQTKTSVSRRIDSVSLPSRCRVMPIILVFLTAFSLHAWGADESVKFSSVYSADDKPTVYNGTNFSVTFDKGTNSNAPIYKTKGAAVRIYGGGYFEVSSTTKNINKIELTFGSGDGTNAITTNGGSFISNTWTGSATSVRFTIGGTTGHRRLASVAVTYASGGGTPTLSSIAVKTPPTKVSYTEGENFDPTGLVITRTYSDASTSDWSYAEHTSDFTFTPSLTTALTTGNTSVTITYGGKSTTQAITVNAGGGGGSGGNTYELVTDDSDLSAGDIIVFAWDNASVTKKDTVAAGPLGSNNYMSAEQATLSGTTLTCETALEFTLSGSAGKWVLTNGTNSLRATSATALSLAASGGVNTWTISIAGGTYLATIAPSKTYTTGKLYYNTSSPRFKNYTSSQALFKIYRANSGPIKVTSSFTEFTYVLGNGPSASQTFKVEGTDLAGNLTITAPTNYQVSQNGSSWSNSVTLNKNAGDDVPETTLYIRLNSGLAKGDYDGNITFSDGTNNKTVAVEGSVTLSCTTPSISFTEATVNKYRGDADFKITPSVSGNTLGAAISWSSDKESCATVGSDGTVHIIKATGAGAYVRITATLPYTETAVACQNEVSAYYDIYIKNKITWLVSGATYTAGGPDTEVTEGAKITTAPTDPDGSSMCGGKTFVGWTTSEVAVEQATAPSPLYSATTVKDVNITDNTTFHAVFAESGGESADKYKKVTSPASEMTTGKRVLIVHNSSSKAMSNTESGIGYAAVSVTPDGEGKITTTNSAIIWTVIKGTTGFFFHQGDNYINAALDKNSNHYLWIDEYPDEWTLTGSGPYVLHSTEDPGYQFECYSNIFQTYTGTSGDAYNMDFYVADIGYTAYSTTCGPNIKAGEVERLTSTLGQTVKSQEISVRGSSLTGGALTVKSIIGDAAQFA